MVLANISDCICLFLHLDRNEDKWRIDGGHLWTVKSVESVGVKSK